MIKLIKWKSLIISILIPNVLGFIGSLFGNVMNGFNGINKPSFIPPAIVFPIVWTILYILMGISYGILKTNNQTDEEIDWIYYIQLAINALWSIIFFTFKWRLFAFIWIILLAIAVISMIIKFYNKNKVAGLLQIPYILWIIFAAYLNFGFYILNR